MINILYADLLALINNNELIPSSNYRITDYTTTTVQTGTTSAGHDFDIIVTALDENTLSENASAVQHEGDVYFTNANLEAWEIKYCIDNDTSRFAWVDSVNGKGVIYYMKDECGNECPYDFKNIQYLKNGVWVYTFGGTVDNSLIGGCHNNKINLYISIDKQALNNITFGNNCYSNTFDNYCNSNTFGNGCNNNTFGIDCNNNTFGDSGQTNTFGGYCNSNTFGDYCNSNTFGNGCNNNTFGIDCNSNTFGDYCNSNTFGIDCNSNTFGDSCTDNMFGNNCFSNAFAADCYQNTFGDDCYSNTFGDDCYKNTFGDSGQTNTFGDNCNSNTFGNGCNNNTFGDNFYSNTFGIDCNSNTFGNNCGFNTLGINSYSNTFGKNCGSNTFGDDCYQNTFCDDCYLNIFGNNCTDNTFGNSCQSNTFDNYCQTNTFGNSGQTNTFGDYCNSNTFGNGCNNNTFGIDCNSNTFGDDCLYNNFYHGTSGTTKQDYLRYIVLEDGVRNNNFYSDVTTSIGNYLQRIIIKGLENDTTTDIQITLPTTNTQYDLVIDYDENNDVIQFIKDSLKSDAPSDNKTYGRKNGNWSEIDTSGGSTLSITWSDLKSLRDAGTLVPGQSYRITDYVCTTTTTDSRAVNNLFDIVVTALSANELSENASATYHEGDTYFSSNNATLESWELKYCIDNDVDRFAWADAVNGKGVIHYIKDNYNNEAPYDFKNIQYLKNGLWLYTFGGAIDNSVVAYYDNVLSVYLYNIDNIIGVYRSKVNQIFKSRLSFNTFGIDCESNTFGDNCYLNSFGDFCYSNTLGFFSGGNTFGDECSSNTFGSYCSSNTFGDSCNSNIFGGSCSSNTFGNSCESNTFGDKCISNTFGNGCYANTFGYDCNSNTFGDGCSSNTFGEDCNYNMFGNSCFYNNFGENCGYNTFGKNCQTNTFGKNCDSNTFGNRCSSNTFGNYCNSNNFYIGTSGTTKKDYIRYIVLEDGCINNNFYSNLTTSDNNYLQRIRIKGLANYSPTPIQITLSEENTNYEWVICYKSDGTLKQYCPAG